MITQLPMIELPMTAPPQGLFAMMTAPGAFALIEPATVLCSMSTIAPGGTETPPLMFASSKHVVPLVLTTSPP